MTKFKAGTSGNPNGRPKGKRNKSTEELRERIADLIDNNFESIQADLDNLEPKERLDFLVRLFEFGLAKLQRISHEGSDQQINVIFENYGDQRLNKNN